MVKQTILGLRCLSVWGLVHPAEEPVSGCLDIMTSEG